MPDPSPNSAGGPAAVPWDDVVRFVRQLSHDLRNHLNAAELQSVFLNEIATDKEMKEEIKRLREMISQLGAVLQKLSSALAAPKANPIPYVANDLIGDIRKKFESSFPDRKANVQWEIDAGSAKLNVDPQLIEQVVLELLDNALRHGGKEADVKLAARIDGGRFVLTVRETKTQFDSATENWGRQPLSKVGQGHYGLGLMRLSAIVAAHAGNYRAAYDRPTSTLVSTIMLPLESAGS